MRISLQQMLQLFFQFSQNILGEFNKEQEEFIKSQQGIQSGIVPWLGHENEEKVKEEIFGLSSVNNCFRYSTSLSRNTKVIYR